MAGLVEPFPGRIPGDEITPQEIVNATRLAIIAEQEAIALYDKISKMVSDPKIQKLMISLADEEQVHVGELTKLIEKLDPTDASLIQEGKDEAEDELEVLSTRKVVASFLQQSNKLG